RTHGEPFNVCCRHTLRLSLIYRWQWAREGARTLVMRLAASHPAWQAGLALHWAAASASSAVGGHARHQGQASFPCTMRRAGMRSGGASLRSLAGAAGDQRVECRGGQLKSLDIVQRCGRALVEQGAKYVTCLVVEPVHHIGKQLRRGGG